MADQPSDLAVMSFEWLKQCIRTQLDRMENKIRDFKRRLSANEVTVAQQGMQIAHVNNRMDRLNEWLLRIEKSLDLSEAPNPAAE